MRVIIILANAYQCAVLFHVHSLKKFSTFISFIHWLVEQKSGLKTLDHYLDDFIVAGASSSNNCFLLMETFLVLVEN